MNDKSGHSTQVAQWEAQEAASVPYRVGWDYPAPAITGPLKPIGLDPDYRVTVQGSMTISGLHPHHERRPPAV
jgi:hypothetical protein